MRREEAAAVLSEMADGEAALYAHWAKMTAAPPAWGAEGVKDAAMAREVAARHARRHGALTAAAQEMGAPPREALPPMDVLAAEFSGVVKGGG